MPENGTVFTRTDDKGKTVERTAYTPADEVKLRFDGWKKADSADKPAEEEQPAEPAEPPRDPVAEYLMRQQNEKAGTDGEQTDEVPAVEEPTTAPARRRRAPAEPAPAPAPTPDPAPSE